MSGRLQVIRLLAFILLFLTSCFQSSYDVRNAYIAASKNEMNMLYINALDFVEKNKKIPDLETLHSVYLKDELTLEELLHDEKLTKEIRLENFGTEKSLFIYTSDGVHVEVDGMGKGFSVLNDNKKQEFAIQE